MPNPSLTRLEPAAPPRAVALLLHGGKERSTRAVDGRSASWRRMATLQRAVSPALHDEGVATWLLRYAARGWNGGAPVRDGRWALARVDAAYPGLPVVLVGHSMGARTAVHLADHPRVVGVVALAPWFPPGEPVRGLADRGLVAAHGRRDHITSPRATREYVDRARAVASGVELRDMGPVGHYMLKAVDSWHEVTTTGVLKLLT